MWIALVFCLLAGAEEAAPTEEPAKALNDTAVMTGPLGPISALVATTLLDSKAFDANLRVHHVLGDRLGVTAQVDFTTADPGTLVHVDTASLRGGPRISLRRHGLTDWTLTPFATLGVTALSAASVRLVRYGLVGGGVECGRTWVWKHFAMELGLGLYTVWPVGLVTWGEAIEVEQAVVISPIKPSLTWSLGYAF